MPQSNHSSVRFYHGTSDSYLDSIRAIGLVPGKGQGGDAWANAYRAFPTDGRPASVYMSRDKEVAADFAALVALHTHTRPIVLALDVPASYIEQMTRDEQDSYGYRCECVLPPTVIADVDTQIEPLPYFVRRFASIYSPDLLPEGMPYEQSVNSALHGNDNSIVHRMDGTSTLRHDSRNTRRRERYARTHRQPQA